MKSRNILGIVIVTGSSGLVGRKLVRALLEINYTVIGFDIVEPHKKRQGSITMVKKNDYV